MRGEICRELTHLALHSLSGGDQENRGRCFDNDKVFFQQAISGYMCRKGAGQIPDKIDESCKLAAELFREESLSLHHLRDWETFYWRGLWSDQSAEWNHKGLLALISLGSYIEEKYSIKKSGEVFKLLADDISLDESVMKVFAIDLSELIKNWRTDVLNRYPSEEKQNDQLDKSG